MNMAIFGVEFGKEYGRQNANILMVGDPHIEIKDDNTIIFTAKDRSLANGFAEYLPTNDKPIFFTKPTAAAKTTIDGKTIEGVSVWIIYRSYASARNKMIDDVINNKNTLVSSSCGDKNVDNNVKRKKLAEKEAAKREKEAAKREKTTAKEAVKQTKKIEIAKNKGIDKKLVDKKLTNYFTKK
jgi:hypothetical protein